MIQFLRRQWLAASILHKLVAKSAVHNTSSFNLICVHLLVISACSACKITMSEKIRETSVGTDHLERMAWLAFDCSLEQNNIFGRTYPLTTPGRVWEYIWTALSPRVHLAKKNRQKRETFKHAFSKVSKSYRGVAGLSGFNSWWHHLNNSIDLSSTCAF